MKAVLLNSLILVGTLGLIATGAAQTKAPATAPATATVTPAVSGPRIQFAETVHDFGRIPSGMARHDFVFTNTGTALLEIKEVRPGCGCTTAEKWDSMVEPGRTGVIPLQFNSTGFSGAVAKAATVRCNDPGGSNLVLLIKADVWNPIEVKPATVVFTPSGEVQTNETRIVRIVSKVEEPVELSGLECTNRSFRTELKTLQPGKEFELLITAVAPFLESRIDTAVTMKTSTPLRPSLTVSVYLNVQPPVTIIPNMVSLPPGPLTNVVRHVLAIQNTESNRLVLSEPAVNVPGVTAQVLETHPGRFFDLTVEFPVGFQAKLGQKVEVTVKSNNPRLPLIQVPVFQPQPAPPPPPAVEKTLPPVQGVPGKSA